MNPEKNSELFEALAKPRIEALSQEFVRRNLLASTLEELSGLFEEKDHTSHPVTEPTLLGRLFALTQIQLTHMGVAGFRPVEAIDYDGSIWAKAAPNHDQFTTSDGNTILTRLIKLTIPDRERSGMEEEVEIFGLNLYQPDANTDEFLADENDPAKRLIIIGGNKKVQDRVHPITGETVVFAVRSKQTRDAKLYK